MRRPETLRETMWRYRGVTCVVCMIIVLAAILTPLVPLIHAPSRETVHTIGELQQHGHTPGSVHQYAVVLDAGSTGSRVHVFLFEKLAGDLKLVNDTFEQLKPGLSSFADDPEAAAKSLAPLMQRAVQTVPEHMRASTPLSLKATAGLRLLPGDKSTKILEAVAAYLRSFKFKMDPDAVAILGGQEEGGFAWLTLNYLLGNLGKEPEELAAAIDLGGGSVQEAFAVSPEEVAAAPKPEYFISLKGAGRTYSVYVHSYLGYGLMAGRAKVIDAVAAGSTHPCFSTGFSSTYEYAGKQYKVQGPGNATEGGGAVEECKKTGVKSLNSETSCGTVQEHCSFNGAWRGRPPSKLRTYYVSSYFWDRATESGIIKEASAVSWPTSIKDFASSAQEACTTPMAALASKFPAVKPDALPYLCLDLAYCHTLLSQGFALREAQSITLVKQVPYNGQNVECAWPLGAAINDLST